MDGQTTIIKVASVKRQYKPSQYDDGQYAITTVTDAKTGLEATCMGPFAEAWKEGDEIEVKWEKNSYTDRNGVARESWRVKNPNAKPAPARGGQGGGSESIIIAAALVGPQYAATVLTPNIAKEAAEKIRKIAEVLGAQAPAPVPAPQPAPAPVAAAAPAPAPAPVAPAPVAAPAPVVPTPAPVVAPAPVSDEEFQEDDKPF